MPIMKLVADNSKKPRAQETSQALVPKSHLDIAIENNYIRDIHHIMISPDGGRFHLSIKTEIEGPVGMLGLQVFGEKEFVSEKAIVSIDAALAKGKPRNKAELMLWKSKIKEYMDSPRTFFMLPE